MCGTSGRLQAGHIFSAYELLHALMLPSGNDAALALAEYFGISIHNINHKIKHKHNKSRIPKCA